MATSPANGSAGGAPQVTPLAGVMAAPVVHLLDPRAHAVDLVSPALGLTKRFYIYLPPGVRVEERVPVVYLFRGHEREWISMDEDSSRRGKTVIDVYEELLAQQAVGPMVLVFPGIASDDGRWSGMLINQREPEQAAVGGALGSGRWEDYFLHDLMTYVEAAFPVDPRSQAVDGFSLGGFMAVKIALQHPELFRSVGAYDGLYFWDNPRDPALIASSDTVFRRAIFAPVYGESPDHAFGAVHNPLNLVRTVPHKVLQSLQWLIEYGPESAEPNDSNYYRGDRLQTLLAERGIANRGGPIAGAHHTWAEADAHMRRTLPFHWRRLHEQI